MLNQKELANELGRSRSFILALQKKGLKVPCPLPKAMKFWERHPRPFSKKRN